MVQHAPAGAPPATRHWRQRVAARPLRRKPMCGPERSGAAGSYAATGATASASAIRSTAFRMFSIEVAKEMRR
jgi:hypothetical protein